MRDRARPTERPRRCPICDRAVPDADPRARFCSPACKLVDLGRWLDGAYRIPGPPVDADVTIGGEEDG